MSDTRRTIDVSSLPHVVFDEKSIMWWGTLGFIVIEGFTLVLVAACYFYLRLDELSWPPGRTTHPDLLVPTINTVLLLLVIVPMYLVDKAGRNFEKAAVTRWLWVATAMTLVVNVLRWFELLATDVRWDTHAYGSIVWALVVLHSTLIIVDLFETGTTAWLFSTDRAKKKHYSDVADAALYQYYLSSIWVPIYLIVYWGPRVL